MNIPVKHKGRIVGMAIVDDEDAELAKWAWRPDRKGYARRNTSTLMHREVMSRALGRALDSSEGIDHIDRDKLNNRRSNLRIASGSLNNANNLSDHVVYLHSRKRWRSSVTRDRKKYYNGEYATRQEAVIASAELMARVWPELVNPRKEAPR